MRVTALFFAARIVACAPAPAEPSSPAAEATAVVTPAVVEDANLTRPAVGRTAVAPPILLVTVDTLRTASRRTRMGRSGPSRLGAV